MASLLLYTTILPLLPLILPGTWVLAAETRDITRPGPGRHRRTLHRTSRHAGAR